MRNYKFRSLLSYLLIISIFLFISVVGFNFVAKAVGSPRISAIYLSSPLTTWTAGAEKVISVRYSDFPSVSSPNSSSVIDALYVWLCNPKTNDCTRFGWPLDNLRLSGGRIVSIKRTIPSNTYDRLKAKDKTLTPYYNGYQAKLKICPSTPAGSASSYGCLYSPAFTVTDPNIVPPEIIVPPEDTITPSVNSVAFLAPVSSWPVGTAKTIKVAYANLGGDFKTVDISMCDVSTNLCNIINTPDLNLSGSNDVNVSQAIGIDDYEEGHRGQLKVCPHSAVVVPKSVDLSNLVVKCASTPVFTITKDPVINSVSIENIASGWQERTIKAINFNYISFDDIYNSVKVRICNPTAVPSRCKDLSDPVLDLRDNGSERIAITFPALSEITSYLSNGSTRLKICPRRSSNGTALATGCAYSSNFLVTATPVVVPPTISSVTISDIASGWQAGATKTITVGYSNFSGDTKTVQINMCNPDNNTCGVITTPTNLNLTGSNQTTVSQTLGNGNQVYDLLMANDPTVPPYINPYYSSTTVNGVKTFYGKLKICPATLAGVVPTGAVCKETPKFMITGSDTDDGVGLPSGQGCFEGECVCVNDMMMKCGRPMQPGTGCAVLIGCNAYQAQTAPRPPQSFLPRLLGASLSFISDNLINLFLK